MQVQDSWLETNERKKWAKNVSAIVYCVYRDSNLKCDKKGQQTILEHEKTPKHL